MTRAFIIAQGKNACRYFDYNVNLLGSLQGVERTMSGPEDKHVLAVSDIAKICQVLEGLLEKGYGPNALTTMLCSSSGTVMLTSSGMPILASLHLSHPVGNMIVDSISKHYAVAGDHSKTLVFLLTEVLRLADNRLSISAMRSKEAQVTERFKLIKGLSELKQNILPNSILPYLLKHSCITCLKEDNTVQIRELCTDLVRTFMAGKLNRQSAAHLTSLVVELLFGRYTRRSFPTNLLPTVQWCIDSVETLCVGVPGQAIQSSSIISGVLIQRDFQHLDARLESSERVKFVLLGSVIGGKNEAQAHQPIFQASSEAHLSSALDWKHKHIEGFLEALKQKGVNLIISSQKLETLTVFLCKKHAISCTQMVLGEDMEHLSLLSQTQIIHSVMDLAEQHCTGTATFCRQQNIGGKRYIHLCGVTNLTKSAKAASVLMEKQMLLCSPSPGVCHQMKCLVLNALKSVRAWLDGGRCLNHLPVCELEEIKECATMPEEGSCKVCGSHFPVEETKSTQEHTGTSITTSTLNHCHEKQHGHAICSPGGGSIELSIYHLLNLYLLKTPSCLSSNLKVACELFADAMLSIPIKLLQNSYAPQASRLSTIQLLHCSGALHAHGQVVAGVDAQSGVSLLDDSHVVEPLFSKISMLYELLDLLQQLLRMNHVVSVSKRSKPNEESPSDDENL